MLLGPKLPPRGLVPIVILVLAAAGCVDQAPSEDLGGAGGTRFGSPVPSMTEAVVSEGRLVADQTRGPLLETPPEGGEWLPVVVESQTLLDETWRAWRLGGTTPRLSDGEDAALLLHTTETFRCERNVSPPTVEDNALVLRVKAGGQPGPDAGCVDGPVARTLVFLLSADAIPEGELVLRVVDERRTNEFEVRRRD